MQDLAANTAEMTNNSFFNSTSTNYSDSLSIELATLQRRILLPILPKEICCKKVLHAYDYLQYEYRTKEEAYVDTVGNFYVTMLMPLIKDGKSTEVHYAAPTTENIINDSGLKTKDYYETNFLNLVIPKYIVMNFRKEIPKGTKFIISFTGGLSEIGSMKIIGIAEIGQYKMKVEDPISVLGMSQDQVISLVRKNVADLNAEYKQAQQEEEKEYGKSVQ